MELENENINLIFKNTQEYINKVEELNGGIELLLAEFKKNYVNAKMNPNDTDIQQDYQDTISNINQLQTNLFSISNDIQVNINNIIEKMLIFDNLIKVEKDKNRKLKKKLGMVEDKNNSALEMISDYREIYEIKYLRNWALFLSTIICIFTINSVFRPSIV